MLALEAAFDAGIRTATVVLGYQAGRVRELVERGAPARMDVDFVLNPEWQLENVASAVAARASVGQDRFALLMGDHVFEPPVLQRMLRLEGAADESLLAVDARPATPEQAEEATKVRREGSRIVAAAQNLDADDIRYVLEEPEFEMESYLRHQADNFGKRFDATTYLYTSRALSYFDLARQDGAGARVAALRNVHARTLLITFSSDWLEPPGDSEELAAALRAAV
jgi:NDP-sugar pyrophosphorylase family protein